jgi:glycosyltransferase involved in cell wall biosynthesis
MGIGGTEQVIRQIIENSDTNKFRHEILCIDGEIGPLGQELKEKGIHIECTRRQRGTDYKLLKYIRKMIKGRDVNVIHCHQYTPYFYGVLSALWTKTRVIFTEHGRFYPDRHNFKRKLVNPLLAHATDHVTAISKSTAEAVSKYEYIPRNRVQIIYNGIKQVEVGNKTRDELLCEIGLSAEFRYIGTISRLERIKNQTMMIKAFFEVKNQIPGIKLVLIGDGEKMQELKQLTRTLDIDDYVIFTGFINNPQRFIRLFDIFLLSSFSEGTSMTLLEAMSLGTPCVVTNVGGNPEVVENNVNGYVVPSDNVSLFSKSILDLLQNNKKRDEFAIMSRKKYLNDFTVSKMVSRYQKIYK